MSTRPTTQGSFASCLEPATATATATATASWLAGRNVAKLQRGAFGLGIDGPKRGRERARPVGCVLARRLSATRATVRAHACERHE